MERPLFLPLLSIIAGLAVADLFMYFVPPFFPFLFLAASFPLLFLTRRLPFFILLSCFFFSWGNLSMKPCLEHQSPGNDIVRFASEQKYAIEGVIDDRPESSENGQRIYLRAERIFWGADYAAVTGRILLNVGEGRGEFLTGDRIRFISRLRVPRNYGTPGEFDYVRFLAYRGVYCTAFVASDSDVILIRRNADYRLRGAIDAIAVKIGRFIGINAPGEDGCILKALLLGDMGGISDQTKDAYTRTGVNHILSISGFHVGIISLFIFCGLLFAVKGSEFLMLHVNARRLILLFTVPVILFYLFLSGAAPATVRSAIMILAFVAAMLLEREADLLNSLMLAAMLILACSPAALFDISFQLSFLALWGIIVLTPILSAPFRRIEGTVLHKPAVFMAVSASAILATLFPVAYYFHRVSATGLVTNIFIVPLMGYGAVIAGFSALPFMFSFPALAALLVKAAAFLIRISNLIINLLAALPTLPPINPTRFDLMLFFLFLTVITFVKWKKARLGLCCTIVALFVSVKVACCICQVNEKSLRITFFSVGQGESTLVRFPDGKSMLIDGGGGLKDGGADIGKRLLAPALWKMGIDRIDYMVLSHAHPDHVKGLIYVAKNFGVGEFWESGIHPAPDESYGELKAVIAERHIPVRFINASTRPILIGKAIVEPISPRPGGLQSESGEDPDENDSSLVFRLKYGDFSMLFTGDIGFPAERRLLGRPELLAATVLKTPHHGSRYSSSDAFVHAVSPAVALIGAGYGNSFGLPSERTLELLGKSGIRICRTDLDGTVEVDRDRNGCHISAFYENGHFH